MCYGKDYKSIHQYTYSSNIYKGVCCKAGISDSMCDGSLLECSMDSIGSSDGKYNSVLTNGRNFQMFSYCPGLTQEVCGISGSKINRDTTLTAGKGVQRIQTKEMRHNVGD